MCMEPKPRTQKNDKKVTILGLGGSGGQIVHHIMEQTDEYNLLYADSDERSLMESTVQTVKNAVNGQTDFAAIANEVKDTKKLIITTGLGGEFGTFTGYIIYKMAKEEKVSDIELILTMPARFEGSKRNNRAKEMLDLLKENNVKYTLIEVDKIADNIIGRISLKDCFRITDEVVYQKILTSVNDVY